MDKDGREEGGWGKGKGFGEVSGEVGGGRFGRGEEAHGYISTCGERRRERERVSDKLQKISKIRHQK